MREIFSSLTWSARTLAQWTAVLLMAIVLTVVAAPPPGHGGSLHAAFELKSDFVVGRPAARLGG